MPVIQLPNVAVGGIPKGVIKIWSGTIATIPSGWALCDGLDGRPNLLDRFVRGIQTNLTPPGGIGGLATVTLTVAQMPSHTHTPSMAPPNPAYGAGNHNHTVPLGTSNGNTGVKIGSGLNGGNSIDLGSESLPIITGTGFTGSTGGGSSHNNIPPFLAVAYIIKITDS